MKKVFLFFLLLITSASPQVNSFRIYPGPVTQTEPVVNWNPLFPDLLFVSAVTLNTQNAFKSEGIYVSEDGGLTWTGSDTCKGAYIGNHDGDPGVAIANNHNLVITHVGTLFPGLFSHYSTDLGITWSSAQTITSTICLDNATTTIDNSSQSPFNGRVYTSWVNAVQPYPVYFAFSSDNGISWSAPMNINSNPPAPCSGPFIKTSADGKIYIAWAGMTSSFPHIEDYIGLAVSADGGANWSIMQNVFDVNGTSGLLPQKENIRINGLPGMAVDRSGGVRNGWIYIVTNEIGPPSAGTDHDVILHRSTDGGTSWSAGIRVNQDQINNGKIQYFPAVTVDEQGGVNVIFYDDRNTTSDSAEVYLARSIDGGNSWLEMQVSGHRFKPKPILGGLTYYQGDHISLITLGTKLHSFWMDDFSGIYQVWTSILDLATLDAAGNDLPAQDFQLLQNYPNPFNPVTTIKFIIPPGLNNSRAALNIYNLLGEKVSSILDEDLHTGEYEVKIDVSSLNLASGIYIYRLTCSGYSAQKKFIFLK